MGVNIFILDRRPANLVVGGTLQTIGSLRRFWKISEIDDERSQELRASELVAASIPSPRAAMVADVEEIPVGSPSGPRIKAHLVIGWDVGRTSVADLGWDYLPTLGYAVRDPDSANFILHEFCDNALHRLDLARGIELELCTADGQLVGHGQPIISQCISVRHYISGYAEADCLFGNGREKKLLVAVTAGALPEPAWFVGKKPMQVEKYP